MKCIQPHLSNTWEDTGDMCPASLEYNVGEQGWWVTCLASARPMQVNTGGECPALSLPALVTTHLVHALTIPVMSVTPRTPPPVCLVTIWLPGLSWTRASCRMATACCGNYLIISYRPNMAAVVPSLPHNLRKVVPAICLEITTAPPT